MVSYASSHLDGAESEKIVPAGHTVFSNELTVLEIKRILEENLRMKNEVQPPLNVLTDRQARRYEEPPRRHRDPWAVSVGQYAHL